MIDTKCLLSRGGGGGGYRVTSITRWTRWKPATQARTSFVISLAISLFKVLIPGKVMGIEGMKACIRQLLNIMDFLHFNYRLIHAGEILNIPFISSWKSITIPGDEINLQLEKTCLFRLI